MLGIIQSWRAKKALREHLLAFLAEMEKNLEIYYVMDQRQFITTGFLMEVWSQAKDLEFIQRQEAIMVYAAALLDFNKAYKEHKSYEQWYSADVKNKTKENALKLHTLKLELDQRIKPLEAIIIVAGQALEQELLNLGFVAN